MSLVDVLASTRCSDQVISGCDLSGGYFVFMSSQVWWKEVGGLVKLDERLRYFGVPRTPGENGDQTQVVTVPAKGWGAWKSQLPFNPSSASIVCPAHSTARICRAYLHLRQAKGESRARSSFVFNLKPVLDREAVSEFLDFFNRVFPFGENRNIPSSQTIRDLFRTEPEADSQLKGLLDSLGARRAKVLAVKGVETIAQFISSPEQPQQLKRLLRNYEYLSPRAKPSRRWQHFDALLEYLEILRAKINQGSPKNQPRLPKRAISLALFPVCWSTIGRVIDISESEEKAFKRFEAFVVQRTKRRHRSTVSKLTTNSTASVKRRWKGRSFSQKPASTKS